ncbi:hypothetical protein L1049_019931 [Liquidambar formosana]|uniref:Uncharacterized protein n=1 Tax=Liquidambar formosana TaxID=63359 RepID=A0AAP0SD95_LIQFO
MKHSSKLALGTWGGVGSVVAEGDITISYGTITNASEVLVVQMWGLNIGGVYLNFSFSKGIKVQVGTRVRIKIWMCGSKMSLFVCLFTFSIESQSIRMHGYHSIFLGE